MKTQLRKGGINTLNVYTLGFKDIGRGLLGQATFPWSYSTDPINDGVILRYSVLPGGNTDLKKDGKTLVHEIGREHLHALLLINPCLTYIAHLGNRLGWYANISFTHLKAIN